MISLCLHCRKRQIRLVSLTRIPEKGEKPNESVNFTEICINKNCWSYINLAKVPSWISTNREPKRTAAEPAQEI